MKKKMRISTPRGNTPTSHGGLFQPWPMLYKQTERQKIAKGTDQKYEAYRQAAMHLLGGLDSIGSEPCCAGEREGRWEGGESGSVREN